MAEMPPFVRFSYFATEFLVLWKADSVFYVFWASLESPRFYYMENKI